MVSVQMKLMYLISTLSILLFGSVYAAGEALTIAIVSYNPPFTIQNSKNDIYGYDIDMMNYLCKLMGRSCKYQVMKQEFLLKAVADKKVDLALNTLTITTERLAMVNFTTPYLLSQYRFLSNDPNIFDQPYSLNLLNNKKIGVLSGSIFAHSSYNLGIQDATILPYDSLSKMLDDFQTKKLNFVLLHNPTAVYWDTNLPGDYRVVGTPFTLGLGVGIAINKNNSSLLRDLNKAIKQYQGSTEYRNNYDRYLRTF